MNEIELSDKEKDTFNIIKKVVNDEKTRKKAMYELNKSRQQIYRLINIYHIKGKQGFIHKSQGKPNSNKIDKYLIQEVENLYLSEYYDYNFEILRLKKMWTREKLKQKDIFTLLNTTSSTTMLMKQEKS